MNIVIINAVPLNGGDEALLEATIFSINQVYPKANIKVLCSQLPLCQKHLPHIDFSWNLHEVAFKQSPTIRRIFKIRQFLSSKGLLNLYGVFSRSIGSKAEKEVLQILDESDIVLASAGGYIHDFYAIEARLQVFEYVYQINKPLLIYGQSVGPFWKASSKKRVKQVLAKAKAVLLREHISLQHLKDCGLDTPNIHVTSDIAFLLHRKMSSLYIQKTGTKIKQVALSFRPWLSEDVNQDNIQKAAQLCTHLIEHYQIQLTFLSTCQGIDNYVNDAHFAERIVAALPSQYHQHCTVDGNRYHPKVLIEKYSSFDAYVGMRLHGAIMSMLGGTPALNIGYEDKTRGIYTDMGLSSYYIDYQEDINNWTTCFDTFAKDWQHLNNQLPSILEETTSRSEKNMDFLRFS